jgi:putative phosphoesterase
MKICIVSDSHDRRTRLAAAVAEAKALGAQAVIHCGDLVAPATLHAIIPLGLPIHIVHGNNEDSLRQLSKLARGSNGLVVYHGEDASITLAGRRIFATHYPRRARAAVLNGDYDLVACGHAHRPYIERAGNGKDSETLLINPGTVGGVGAPATYILGDLEKMEFTVRSVPKPADEREPRGRGAAG